ncbi:MAG: outer membrane beta-barrel protein [Gemmatimonadales bacterium]|nr:outer membrane beta-barrel protein [Gemmatimonadales bacterium]MDZ4388675.1 outer membrane beta-barrel protein [Gemmatimonadales bacterium]
MARSVLAGFALVAMVVAAAPLAAQNEHVRQGFWFNGGLGYGSLGCDGCDGREGGVSAQIGIGGTLSQKVLLGAMSNSWYKEVDGTSLTVSTLVAGIRFYPSATGGFYLTGGLGLGSIRADFDDFGTDTETGVGAMFGAGWDIRVGRNVSLTPFVSAFGMDNGDVDANVTQFGLSVTIH